MHRSCTALTTLLPCGVGLSRVAVFTPAFVIHRGPFRLTGQIDALNDLLAELRQRRVVSTSGVGNGVGGGSRPESGAAAVAPVTVALRGKREAERGDEGGVHKDSGDGQQIEAEQGRCEPGGRIANQGAGRSKANLGPSTPLPFTVLLPKTKVTWSQPRLTRPQKGPMGHLSNTIYSPDSP